MPVEEGRLSATLLFFKASVSIRYTIEYLYTQT